MKRVFKSLVAGVLSFGSLLPCAVISAGALDNNCSQSGACENSSVKQGEGWYFNSESGELIISSDKAMDYPHDCGRKRSPWFAFRQKITKVVINPGVTKIERYAFYGCKKLESISIPDSVTEIGSASFKGCKSLKGVVIPNGVTWIAEELFCGCINLENVSIPDSVTDIGSCAFEGCENLKD